MGCQTSKVAAPVAAENHGSHFQPNTLVSPKLKPPLSMSDGSADRLLKHSGFRETSSCRQDKDLCVSFTAQTA